MREGNQCRRDYNTLHRYGYETYARMKQTYQVALHGRRHAARRQLLFNQGWRAFIATIRVQDKFAVPISRVLTPIYSVASLPTPSGV